MSPGRHDACAGSRVTMLLSVGAISRSSLRRGLRGVDLERRSEAGDTGVHDHLGSELLDEFDGARDLRRRLVLRSRGDRLGAHADGDAATDPCGEVVDECRCVERDHDVTDDGGESRVATLDGCGEEVHRRRTDERGDEEVGRPVVEIARSIALLDLAAVEHGDTVAHRHRLDLIVGDVDGRRVELALQAGRSRHASARAAWRRGSTAARPSGTPTACERSPAPSRRAGAARRRAGRACGRARLRVATSGQPRRPARRSPPTATRPASTGSRCSCERSCAGTSA